LDCPENQVSAENPYRSPTTSSAGAKPLDDRIRISNFNHAGVPLAIAFVIGPILLAGLIWLAAHGRVVNGQGIPANSEALAIIALVGLAEVVACAYALRVPVLWLEIGPTLRYATALAVREVAWDNVQRIWIDREDWKGRAAPFVAVTFVKHMSSSSKSMTIRTCGCWFRRQANI
jgi:hypothetical protein